MHKRLSLTVAAAPLLALAACGDTSMPDGVNSEPANALPDGEAEVAAPTDTTAETERTIPAPLQGQWGMADADCTSRAGDATSRAGDAKGLLTIDATTLRFYESLGTLSEVQERDASHLVARFDFVGEGMEWSRTETLKLDGAVLIRSTDAGDAQGPYEYQQGPYEYQRCG